MASEHVAYPDSGIRTGGLQQEISMQTTERVIVDGRAMIGWYHLPAPDRERIQQRLAALAEQPIEQWPSMAGIEVWRPAENLYALHTEVGHDHLLVFFRPEQERIRLEDMILKETIDRYFTPRNGCLSTS
jgi:hypothetical protein